MDTTTLGRSGITTSRLGFGMWPIGGTKELGDYGVVDDDLAVAAIQRGLDLGVTLFDTAPAYGEGRAEEILGRALGDRSPDVSIVTKCAVRWDWDSGKWVTESTRDSILGSANESLRRLRRDVIDVLLIHVPDPAVEPEEPMRAFEDLKQAGKIRYAGVSNFTLDQLQAYRTHGSVDVIQIGYHLFDRRMEQAMLPLAEEAGIGVMTLRLPGPRSADGGLETGPQVRCQGLARRGRLVRPAAVHGGQPAHQHRRGRPAQGNRSSERALGRAASRGMGAPAPGRGRRADRGTQPTGDRGQRRRCRVGPRRSDARRDRVRHGRRCGNVT